MCFLAEAAYLRDGEGVPRFVEEECQAFLTYGWRAGGFARFRCGASKAERLVALSYKGRGSLRVPAGQRDRLERVCRYARRPPVAGERLQLAADVRWCGHCATSGPTARRT